MSNTLWTVFCTLLALVQLKGMWWAWRWSCGMPGALTRAVLVILWPVMLLLAMFANVQ